MRHQLINEAPERTFALVFERGDDVMSTLQRFAAEHRLTASRFTAIGAFERARPGVLTGGATGVSDTGATLTAISEQTAEAAGLQPREGGLPVRMQTANGTIPADLTTIDELRFGNVAARGLDAIIAPGMGPTNVIGMNLLSRLASWRVEGDTMILVPNHPQPAVEPR